MAVLFLGALAAACSLLSHVLPNRELPWSEREKITHLTKHGKDYDALFLGSSRVQSHVLPSLFDQDVARQGLPLKAFNAGVAGLYPPQDAYLLDQILPAVHGHLRWVFLELQPFQMTLPPEDRETERMLSWHDWPRYVLECERFATASHRHWRDRIVEISERWPDLCAHTDLFFRHITNLGRGSTLLDRWALHEPAPPLDCAVLGPQHDGWLAAAAQADSKSGATLESDLARRRTKPAVPETADPLSRKALAQMMNEITQAGATPVLIIPPTARGTYFLPHLAPSIIVLNFSDPTKYPELYDLKYRVDQMHLNAAGAKIFTHLLAQQFLKALQVRASH